MRYLSLIVLLLLHLAMGQASEPLYLKFQGTNHLFEMIGKKVVEKIPTTFSLPNVDVEECRKEGYFCQVKNIQGRPNLSSNYQHIILKVFADQTIGFGVDLPAGQLSANIRAGGNILGIKYDVNFKVELSSLRPVGPLETKTDFERHGGLLTLAFENDRLKVRPIRLPDIRLHKVRITPTDNLAKIVYKAISAFTNIEHEVLKTINQEAHRLVSSKEIIQLIEDELGAYTDSSLALALPFPEFALNASLKDYQITSQTDQLELRATSDITPLFPAAVCTEKFHSYAPKQAAKYGNEKSRGELGVPLDLIPKALFTFIKYPAEKNLQEETFPCFRGTENFSFGILKFDLDIQARPTGQMNYRFEPETNSFELWLDLKFEARNMEKFPRVSFNRIRGFKRIDGAIVQLYLNFKLKRFDDTYYLVLDKYELPHIDGRVTLGVFGKNRGPSFKLKRFKSLLLEEIHAELKADFSKIKFIPATTSLIDGIKLVMKKLKIEDGAFKFLFKLE